MPSRSAHRLQLLVDVQPDAARRSRPRGSGPKSASIVVAPLRACRRAAAERGARATAAALPRAGASAVPAGSCRARASARAPLALVRRHRALERRRRMPPGCVRRAAPPRPRAAAPFRPPAPSRLPAAAVAALPRSAAGAGAPCGRSALRAGRPAGAAPAAPRSPAAPGVALRCRRLRARSAACRAAAPSPPAVAAPLRRVGRRLAERREHLVGRPEAQRGVRHAQHVGALRDLDVDVRRHARLQLQLGVRHVDDRRVGHDVLLHLRLRAAPATPCP